MSVQFELGCDPNEFEQYYALVQEKTESRENGLMYFRLNPDHLIIWRKDGEIIGHTIWHESSTDEHRKGDSRDPEDQATLRQLFGGKAEFVELHEIWLKEAHRGNGYGSKFFTFFEDLMQRKGFTEIAYYAYNPAALAICRKRGYQEGNFMEMPGFEGRIEKTYVLRKSL
jgi:GNAT superfamily N-acetyltransferase